MTPGATGAFLDGLRVLEFGHIAAAPFCRARTTIALTPIASTVRAVSTSVSPLFTLDAVAVRSTTSADTRRAASVKLVFVRVESSKNSVATVFRASAPVRVSGTFATGIRSRAAESSARSSAAGTPRRPRRSRPCHGFEGGTAALGVRDPATATVEAGVTTSF